MEKKKQLLEKNELLLKQDQLDKMKDMRLSDDMNDGISQDLLSNHYEKAQQEQ